MKQGQTDHVQVSLLWSGGYLLLHTLWLAAMVIALNARTFPALGAPALHVAGPVVLAVLVLWRALRTASARKVMRLARVNLVILVVLTSLCAILFMVSRHQNQTCAHKASAAVCVSAQPPIIRNFNPLRPEYRPDIPANP